ncbi:unnamed protein product, partial [Mesorhabditis spiculigera]
MTLPGAPIISLGAGLENRRFKELAYEAGLRVKKFSARTDVLVSTSVLDPDYRVAVSLGIPIVRPVFIEYASGFADFRLSPDIVAKSRLPRFAGSRVFLALFLGEAAESKKELIEEHGGSICQSALDATHVVVPIGEDYPTNGLQYVVTEQWISESLNLGWCANEKLFPASGRSGKLIRRDALRRGNCEAASKKIPSSFRKLKIWKSDRSDTMKYKRYTQAGELYKSETETLKKLDALKRELYNVHSRIVEKLAKVFATWADDSVIGLIFIEESDALAAAYTPYLVGLQYAQDCLKKATQRSPKFKAYIQKCECDRMLGRSKISELVSAPYQELTNKINVLLRELLKNTAENMPDFASLRQAVNCITGILEQVNELKRANSEAETVFRQIENIPANRFDTSRSFMVETVHYDIASQAQKEQLKKLVSIPSFNSTDSPIVKLRTFSKRLSRRKAKSAVDLQTTFNLTRTLSTFGIHSHLPDLIPDETEHFSNYLEPILHDEALIY